MYICHGTRESCRKTADMIELLQVEMEHNPKPFKAAWNSQLSTNNLREDKLMMHKMHNVFVVMLRKSGMTHISRVDTNHILKEIGLNPDKRVDVEWKHLQTQLRFWTRPYSPLMPQDEELLMRLGEDDDGQGNRGINGNSNSLGFFRRRLSNKASNKENNMHDPNANSSNQQRSGSRLSKLLHILFSCSKTDEPVKPEEISFEALYAAAVNRAASANCEKDSPPEPDRCASTMTSNPKEHPRQIKRARPSTEKAPQKSVNRRPRARRDSTPKPSAARNKRPRAPPEQKRKSEGPVVEQEMEKKPVKNAVKKPRVKKQAAQ